MSSPIVNILITGLLNGPYADQLIGETPKLINIKYKQLNTNYINMWILCSAQPLIKFHARS